MSFNRPIYDPCAYDKRLDESTSVLSWQLDPSRYYNCNQCRIEFGLVGGNNVSLHKGNLVDLESELRNQTRLFSQCPSRKFLPGTTVQGQRGNGCKPGCGTTGLPCGSLECRTQDSRHLPGCQMIQYKPRIDNVGYKLDYAPCPSRKVSKKSKKIKRPATTGWDINAWQGQMGANY